MGSEQTLEESSIEAALCLKLRKAHRRTRPGEKDPAGQDINVTILKVWKLRLREVANQR